MRKIFIIIPLLLIFAGLQAQHTSFSVSANSGLFYFGGKSASRYSNINKYSDNPHTGYTNSPYGTIPGFSYGLSGQVQRITKGKNIYGISLGYESQESKIDITFTSSSSAYVPTASGQSKFRFGFINLFPYFGHRFTLSKSIRLDLTGGFDLGFCQSAHEKGKAIDENDMEVTTDLDREKPKTDFRPRIQLAAYYKKWGVYAGYSHGLTNYTARLIGGPSHENFARMVRFGLSYLIH